jgi:ParB-like chromosome segregation protein Spo0J
MNNPELQTEKINVGLLQQDPTNARLHDETNLSAIMNSLKLFGQIKPIVITHDNRVLAGNGTLTAAIKLGWKQITCVRTPDHWSDKDAMAYAIADNRTGELADWNADVLASQLVDLNDAGWSLNELGFATVPVSDTSVQDQQEEHTRNKNAPDPIITCPKCGNAWLRSSKRGTED